MSEAVDFDSLNWVKGEITKNLQGIRAALEQFLETEDTALLQQALKELKQVKGTLQMLDIQGAFLLAQETASSIEDLLQHPEKRQTEAYEALMQAILVLPNYLEWSKLHRQDMPLALLPFLNALRRARGVEPLGEKALFHPALSVQPPSPPADATHIKEVIPKVRPAYEKALLHWLRRDIPEGHTLEALSSILETLRQAVQPSESARLWWITEGIIEALKEGGLEPDFSLQHLLGELDHQMHLLQKGQTPSDEYLEGLTRDLLFLLARTPAQGALVTSLKKAFHLDEAMPSPATLEAIHAELTAPPPQLLKDVLPSLQEDLSAIKATLDHWTRMGEVPEEERQTMEERLQKVSDTLGMLGLETAQRKVGEQKEKLIQGVEPAHLGSIASGLLEAETLIEQALSPEKGGSELIQPLLKEIREDLNRVIEALDQFSRRVDTEALSATLPMLKRIMAALSMAGLSRAADLLHVCHAYIEERLLKQPEDTHFFTLADALAGFEQYLTALEQGSEGGLWLDRMAQYTESLKDLLAMQPEESPEIAQEEVSPPAEVHEERPELPEGIDADLLEVFLEEAEGEMATIETYLPQWEEHPEDEESLTTIRRSFHTLKGSGRMVGATLLGEFAWAFEHMLNRVIDKTIPPSPSLFALLHQALPALRQLVEQLKGGPPPGADIQGLMEKAHALAEGRSLEQPPVPGQETATEEPQTAPFPQEEKTRAQAEKEAEAFPDIALPTEIHQGVAVEEGQPETETPQEAKAPPEMETSLAEEQPPPLEIESELAAIFLEEASELVDKNEDAIQAWRQAPEDHRWIEELQRNLHTLKGSARMAGIMPIGDLSHALESLVVAAKEGHISRSDAFFELLQEGNDRLASMVEAVSRQHMPPPAKDVEERIAGMLHPERQAVEARPEPPLPPPEDEQARALLETFLETSPALLHTLKERIQAWREKRDARHLEDILDTLHALQSGAQASGLLPVAELSQALCSLPETLSPEGRLAGLEKGYQALASMISQAREGKPIEPDPSVAAFLHRLKQAMAPTPSPVQAKEGAPAPGQPRDEKEAAIARGQPRYEQVRVRAELLDKLINYAAEINIYHSRMEQQVHAFHYAIEEMDQTTTRLEEQIRRLYLETEAQMLFHHPEGDVTQDDALFDPLELDRYTRVQQLSRALAESVNDLENIENLLTNLTKDSEMLLVQEGRVETELQEGLMRARMLPFAVLVPRLRRTVRQNCAELGKRAQLLIEGGDIELDRAVLDKIAAPLEHILRNAIDHGIEPPDIRKQLGKSPIGVITLHLERKGTEVILQVMDDGAGIDVEAVRQTAIEKGLMKPDTPLSDQEVLPFIMEPGFTTSKKVSMVSGRGVGMDVVDTTVKQLGGTVHIASQRGQGTSITIHLPLMLSITQALVVRVREEVYAIPLTHIRAIQKIKQDALMELYAQQAPEVEHAGERYPLLHLGTLLEAGPPKMQEGAPKIPLLLVHIGDLQAALHIEDIVGRQEIVVKPLGAPLNRIRGLLGATILPDGAVALILDTATVLRRATTRMRAPTPAVVKPAAEKKGQVTVMVVDDSITMRKVAARLLERHGMEVITAKDGVDALERLQQQKPDILLLDIEMPRMDGYELARHIRHDPELADIPIIMVTSRIGEKHRKYAESIGVDKYIGKPYQEAELVESIRSTVNR